MRMGLLAFVLSLGMLTAAPRHSTALMAATAAAQQVSPGPDGTVAPGAIVPDPAAGAMDSAAGDAGEASGLPRRSTPPRTMAAHWPVFVLFAASWLGIAVFLLMTGRRSVRLVAVLREREVRP